jgi:hypothetical protein
VFSVHPEYALDSIELPSKSSRNILIHHGNSHDISTCIFRWMLKSTMLTNRSGSLIFHLDNSHQPISLSIALDTSEEKLLTRKMYSAIVLISLNTEQTFDKQLRCDIQIFRKGHLLDVATGSASEMVFPGTALRGVSQKLFVLAPSMRSFEYTIDFQLLSAGDAYVMVAVVREFDSELCVANAFRCLHLTTEDAV